MTWRRRAVQGALLLLSVFWVFVVPTANAQDVSVTATVVDVNPIPPPNPIVEFKGLASPTASITVKRNGLAAATATAATNGNFDMVMSDQPVGQQTFEINAIDVDGRNLTPMTFALNLTVGSTTIVLNIFLGPSIEVDKAAVKLGQFLTVSGSTVPSSTVSVLVNSVQAQEYSVLADISGRWSKLINSQEIGVGSHTARARAAITGTGVSEYSASVAFAVNPLEQCDGKKTADLNCDGRVNLTDFSILLFFWQQRNPANARADINGDTLVTITDFSIMLFQWTS